MVIHAKDATRGPASLSLAITRAEAWVFEGKQRPGGIQPKDNIKIHGKCSVII